MERKLTDRQFQNRSLERAIHILNAFSFEKKEHTLSSLSGEVGLAKSTCHRLAATLMDYGYLSYDPSFKVYSLGPKLFELGSVVYDSISLRKIASPFLSDLLLKVGNKAVALAILEDDEIVYVDRKEDVRNPIKFATTEVGRRRPPYFGMFGLLLLAYLPNDEVDRLLTKYPPTALTGKSITDLVKYKEALKQVRERGYSFDEEGAFESLSAIAAPIKDGRKSVIAGVGCSFISGSVDEQAREAVITAVCETARAISDQLSNMVLPRTVWGRR